MAFLRPGVQALFERWSGVAAGLALALAGLWLLLHPGWITLLLGGGLIALGLSQALLAHRRLRFASDLSAPGLVEIDEGRLRFFHPSAGPATGGEISLNDLASLHLLQLQGRRVWRLRDLSGQALLVPLDVGGAEALFDALAALPGLSSAQLIRALDGAEKQAQRRPGPGPGPGPGPVPGRGAGQPGPGLTLVTGPGSCEPGLQETAVWTRPGSGLSRA